MQFGLKTRSLGYSTVKTAWSYFQLSRRDFGVLQTDGQTDGQPAPLVANTSRNTQWMPVMKQRRYPAQLIHTSGTPWTAFTDHWTEPNLSCSARSSFNFFCLVPCSRLSWLPVSFWLHVILCSKRQSTTFSMISWTRTVCLQRFLAHVLIKV